MGDTSDLAEPPESDRSKLIAYALERGATAEAVEQAPNLGEFVLDLNLRQGPRVALSEVLAELRLDEKPARRLLTALGLPLDFDQLMTEGEIAAFRLFAIAGTELFGEEAAVQVARVAGGSMARIAEMLVATFRLQVEWPRRSAGVGEFEFATRYSVIAQSLLPEFMRTLDALLRRQILTVAERIWEVDDKETAVMLPRTIGFVDLVGYTEASSSMSVGELASLLAEFDERVSESVQSHFGQVVKTIGDEAMFATELAADACRIALALVRAFDDGNLPQVRVGLANGDVLSVFGDLYGPDVNLAARLVSVAEPSSVLVSESVRAGAADGFHFEARPSLRLKGFASPVDAFVLR